MLTYSYKNARCMEIRDPALMNVVFGEIKILLFHYIHASSAMLLLNSRQLKAFFANFCCARRRKRAILVFFKFLDRNFCLCLTNRILISSTGRGFCRHYRFCFRTGGKVCRNRNLFTERRCSFPCLMHTPNFKSATF